VTREVLDRPSLGGEGDVVHVPDLYEFAEDQLSAAVAVEEGRHVALLGERGDGVGDVRPLHGDGVLDAVAEQRQHVGAALDDDDGVGAVHVRTGREPRVLGDILDADRLADLLEEFVGGHHAVVERLAEQLLGAVDDLAPLGGAHVLDGRHLDAGPAGADAGDRLEGGREDGRLDLVEAAGDGDLAEGLSVLAVYLHVDASDFRGLLEVAEVEVVTEQALGLPEDGADDVAPLDDAVGRDGRVDEVF
jgi:hypothetical protein